MSVQDVVKEIKKLGTRKIAQSKDITVKILKKYVDIFGSYICDFFNDCVRKGDFPSILKLANITPVFKKGFKGSKYNYQPVSILLIISKIFEKFLCKQITFLIDPLLSSF